MSVTRVKSSNPQVQSQLLRAWRLGGFVVPMFSDDSVNASPICRVSPHLRVNVQAVLDSLGLELERNIIFTLLLLSS